MTALLAGGVATPARAQDVPASLASRLRSTLSLDVSLGGATSLFGGVTDPGHGTFAVALHTRVPLVVRSRLQLDYLAGLVPVELAIGTRVAGAGSLGSALQPERVFGAGVDGLGLVAHPRGGDRWHPYVGIAGGVRLFERPVPDPRGTRFNFSADFGAGVAVRLAPRRWLAASVALHHLSNGGLGAANPSYNGFNLTLSLARR